MLMATFLNEPRALQTATLLDDGKVLLAGGFNGTVAISGGILSGASGSISNSAEIFDPNTLEFSCVGGFSDEAVRCNQSMSVARAGHTATLLSSGPLQHRVLITGGIGAADPNARGCQSRRRQPVISPIATAPEPRDRRQHRGRRRA